MSAGLLALIGLAVGASVTGLVLWRGLARKLSEARGASQAKSAFLARISHELRTPLNAIVGYVEALRDGLKGEVGREQLDVLGKILAAARSLEGLIAQLLDFSKVEAGKLELTVSTFRLESIVKAQLELARPASLDKKLKLRFEEPMGGVELTSDMNKVQQVVSNLIQNAVKFTESGEVCVRLRSDSTAGMVLFEVEDTGIGIPSEELAHIFEPFRQVEDPMRRRAGGTGLGLAIVQEYAYALGGAVSVSSTVGRGSRFSVALPLQSTRFMRRTEDRAPAERFLKRTPA